MLRNVVYYFKQLWINITRNLLMSFAAISTSFFSQLILGALILVVFNINHISTQIWSQVEIWGFMETTNREDVVTRAEQIQENRMVRGPVEIKSPKKALEELEKDLEIGLWDRDEENPLPWTLVVRVHDPDQVEPVVDFLINDLGFKKDDLRYPKDVVRKINTASLVIKVGGYLLTVLMAGLTLFIIINTIRLTVIARRAEIRTMQLVGATSWFIRWPFLLEGIIIGLTGSFVSALILSIMYYFGHDMYMRVLFFLPHPIGTLHMIKILFIVAGISGFCMGLAGSYISVTKFLDEEV
jgi:cell division transport system permease protein